jgi:DNA polymerase elongation subunit (family B)
VNESGAEVQKYLIKVYGVTQEGHSVSVNILDFTPFFMIRVNHKVTPTFITRLHEHVVLKLPINMRDYVISTKVKKKKDFWGFHNNDTFSFVQFTFRNHNTFKAVMRMFQKDVHIVGYHNKPVRYKIYESNIEPFLRFIHIKDILPSGWLMIPEKEYDINESIYPTTCQIDISCKWQVVQPYEIEKIAPIVVASFDIECTSSHGDFPVPCKDYKKVAYELLQAYNEEKITEHNIVPELLLIFCKDKPGVLSKVFPKEIDESTIQNITTKLRKAEEDIVNMLKGKTIYKADVKKFMGVTKASKDDIIKSITRKLGMYDGPDWTGFMPKLQGDPIIQIGTTVHKYGDRECCFQNIITVGSCEAIPGVDVVVCDTEKELLLKWRNLIQVLDPDIITGYNIFGFDFWFMYERARELGIAEQFCKLGKVVDESCPFVEKKLSSSALGDNIMRIIDMDGRVLIDIMKVVQRDHKLDSYKLDHVANHFMKMNKHDVSPNDIFALYQGSAADRRVIAEYCVQDCSLCNKLMMKLEILANNIGMSNVCNVPLSYIFMRGQGVKIFSLVSKQCREEDFAIPTFAKYLKDGEVGEDEDGYEGAIVLPPKEGIYLQDPVSVLDYASLYPSSMISENLSHDCLVLDPKYDNLPGVEYLDITYDVYDMVDEKKVKVGEKVCRFYQPPDGEKGVIPRILMKLLKARKDTRKKIEYKTVTTKVGNEYVGLLSETEDAYQLKKIDGEVNKVAKDDVLNINDTYDEFQKAVLDGLQLAYKVTANSLYGQIGAKTSPIYLKEIAACTTATGRKMICMARDYMLENYEGIEIIYGDSVTGDTPLLIRYDDGTIDIVPISCMYGEDGWVPYTNFKPFDTGRYHKEQSFVNAEVWANGRWAKINRVIRHKTNKKIYRINTFEGSVDVTEDHSLLNEHMEKITPGDCQNGMTKLLQSFPTVFPEFKTDITKHQAWLYGLFFRHGFMDENQWYIEHDNLDIVNKAHGYLIRLENFEVGFNIISISPSQSTVRHRLVCLTEAGNQWMYTKYIKIFYDSVGYKRIPYQILNSAFEIRHSFIKGYTDKTDNMYECRNKLEAQCLYYLMRSIGWDNIYITTDNKDHFWISNIVDKESIRDTNLVVFKNHINDVATSTFVYDIETEDGNFNGGIGSIVLSNTDSLFLKFPINPNNETLDNKEKVKRAWDMGYEASQRFKKLIKQPHDLEMEKVMFPFILFSKKRYCAYKYEGPEGKPKMNSMGIALKRRDNAPIVKHVYGGVLDIILNKQDIDASIVFLQDSLNDLIKGKFALDSLVISKSLKSDYKDPEKIAHKVLAERMGERDPGNKPMVNDRIPFVYIQTVTSSKQVKVLQGDRIEHPDYIRKNNLKPDYEFYITNQIMKPIVQLYALTLESLPGFRKGRQYFQDVEKKLIEEKGGDMKKVKDRLGDLREAEVKKLLFDPVLIKLANRKAGNTEITHYFKTI